jgi:hypothetical protein
MSDADNHLDPETPHWMVLNPPTPWDEIDPPIRELVRELNEFPGIKTISSCGGHDEPAAEKDGRGPGHWDVFLQPWFDFPDDAEEVWPDRNGWLTLEFLCWVVGDLRSAGKRIRMALSSAPPYLNGPGRCLTFVIEGERFDKGGYTPEEFISNLRKAYPTIYAPLDELEE